MGTNTEEVLSAALIYMVKLSGSNKKTLIVYSDYSFLSIISTSMFNYIKYGRYISIFKTLHLYRL
jgi:hypothetical protein